MSDSTATAFPLEGQLTTGCKNKPSSTGEAQGKVQIWPQQQRPPTAAASKKKLKLKGRGWDGAVGSEISTGDAGTRLLLGVLTDF